MPNDIDDLFGSPTKTTRYSARPAHKPWGITEDFVLLPVLLACESDFAYLECCSKLCNILDRNPVFPSGARPSSSDRIRECKDILERRTVTEFLSGRPDATKFMNNVLFVGHRTGLPLSWTERTKFLIPYHRKPFNRQSRITIDELLMLLERGPSDRGIVLTYLNAVQRGETSVTEILDAPRPCGGSMGERTAIHVRRFVGINPADEPAACKIAWRWLHENLVPRESNG